MRGVIWTLVLVAVAVTVAAGEASAAQSVNNNAKRIYADANTKVTIDGIDDWRLDVDVAVLDTPAGPENPELNIVSSVDCFDNDPTPENNDPTDHTGCDPGWATPDNECHAFHGEAASRAIGAIDNDYDEVGIAPGARIWSVGVADKRVTPNPAPPCDPGSKPFYLSDVIAGVEWVTEHADQIEVANMSMEFSVPTSPAGEALDAALEQAINESIEAGVVYVAAAGNGSKPLTEAIPAKYPGVITATAILDSDGLPGGLGTGLGNPPCTGPGSSLKDDTNADVSNFGPAADPDDLWSPGADIAAPGFCTSNASAHVAGAAAVLASSRPTADVGDVAAIRNILLTEGNSETKVNGGWDDRTAAQASDREPLLDIHDESLFAPNTVPGADPPAVDSDVTGDGKADLVTLRHNGVVYVHPGNSEAKFTTGKTSFSGSPLNPAQYDGTGHYVVDVADVAGYLGEKRADLITLDDQGDVHVYAGNANGSFDETGTTSELNLTPGLLQGGGDEPIAAADVDGDGHADLIVHRELASQLLVYLGQADGSFGLTPVIAQSSIASALHTATGHYFIDAADLTGDNRAELVSMHEGALKAFAGQPDGTFATAVSSQSGIDPAMDDGSGYEPTGLADVTGDGLADLGLIKASTTYIFPGSEGGTFATALQGSSAGATSTTFGNAGNFEIPGLLDVDGSGKAELLVLSKAYGTLSAIPIQANGSFGTPATSSGTFPSTQHEANQNENGNQFATEKPSWRRRGCEVDGCGWVIRSAPGVAGTTDNRLTGVSCASPTFCVATANLVLGGISYGYPKVWNGSAWAETSGKADFTSKGITSSDVSCTSASACTVVGHDTEENGEVLNFAARWNGSEWNRQEVPLAAGGQNRLTGVSCVSATYCMATGNLLVGSTSYGYAKHWNGASWQNVTGKPFTNKEVVMSDVSCTSASACTVVGHETEEDGDVVNFAASSNGTVWTARQEVPLAAGGQNRLTGVSCVSATYCMATGNLLEGSTSYGYAKHWNGASWQNVTGTPFTSKAVAISDVSCTSATSCTVVGNRTEENGHVLTFAAHASGVAWTGSRQTPNPANESRLEGVSCLFPGGCVAVGRYVNGSGTWNLAEHAP